MLENNSFLVSANWLEKNLDKPKLRIIDASWYLPGSGIDPEAEYKKSHIPGAVFLDQDSVTEKNSPLPHTLPTAEDFSCYVGAMGIAHDDTIIVYDNDGFFSAPRIWWLFRIMGANSVYVLNGGFRGWKNEGRTVTDETTVITPANFHASFDKNAVVMLDEMRSIVNEGRIQIVDTRSNERFRGDIPEPRPGLKPGHMPGARNCPSGLLSNQGYLKTGEDIRSSLLSAGIDPDKPVVASCGSGVTAAVLVLVLQSLGNRNVRLYDGSWSEWGSLPDTPVETDEAN